MSVIAGAANRIFLRPTAKMEPRGRPGVPSCRSLLPSHAFCGFEIAISNSKVVFPAPQHWIPSALACSEVLPALRCSHGLVLSNDDVVQAARPGVCVGQRMGGRERRRVKCVSNNMATGQYSINPGACSPCGTSRDSACAKVR